MKKIIACTVALALLAGTFAAGYRLCFLQVLRNGRFYAVDEMLLIDFCGEYNEVFLEDDIEPLYEKYAQG